MNHSAHPSSPANSRDSLQGRIHGAPVAVVSRLARLAPNLYKSQQNRIDFVCVALEHGLVQAITSYALWDAGWEGLGERQWDGCFEQGDAEEVIAEVVCRARAGGFLDAVRDYCNVPGAFERWLSYADRQGSLF